MPDYDFKALSPIDFEILIRDLLQKELNIRLESFKQGKDQGIDFRHCSDSGDTLIIQCKHYAESTFATLLSNLKKESEKAKKLKPTRYILATSLGLTPKQKKEIQSLFKPTQNLADIYGKEDLNNLLSKFPEIEKQTFKLWLTSIAMLENLLHGKIINMTHDAKKRIEEHAKYYVRNESFSEALNMLKKNNVCLIVGLPGIGKSMLAEMLLLDFVRRGYEIIKIDNNISDAYELVHHNQKRVYYYDDFLGQTALSQKFKKNEDQGLLDFIEITRKSKVSKLILTTREYILNQARETYEKISRANFKPEIYTIDLSKYTREIRAKILYNHIYFSDLNIKLKQTLLDNQGDLIKIIDHKNYNPRIIEFMTQSRQLLENSSQKYSHTFLSNLNNPSQIWKHAFEHQLSQKAQNLLLTMVTLPSSVFLDNLETVFSSYHRKQASEHNISTNPKDFKSALKELDGNFLRLGKSENNIIAEFHNPSIRDFLENYLSSSDDELRTLIRTAYFYEQLEWFWEGRNNDSLGGKYTDKLINKFSSLFLDKVSELLSWTASCTIVNYSRGDGTSYKGSYPKSFEDKISLIASISLILKSERAKNLLREALNAVEERIRSKTPDHYNLIHMLKTLKGYGLTPLEIGESLLDNTKKYLLTGKTDWISDFEPICNYMESFPELFSINERSKIAEDAMNVLDSSLNDYDNPDLIYQDLDLAKKLEKHLNVDNFSGLLDEMEDRAKDLADRNTTPNEDDYVPTSKTLTDNFSNHDIESLFRTLI